MFVKEASDVVIGAMKEDLILSVSDTIALVGAIASIVLTVVVAVVQYQQSKKMAEMEMQINQKEEQRHQEDVDSQAARFLITYGHDRYRLPLCAIAAMYDDTFLYSSEIYRAFCGFPREIQNRILKRSGTDLVVREVPNLVQKAIDFLHNYVGSEFPNNQTPFYDDAKYVIRSIERYRDTKYEHSIDISDDEVKPSNSYSATRPYAAYIIDRLHAVLEERGISEAGAIDDLMRLYSFQKSNEASACQFATTLAYWLVVYSKGVPEEKKYGGIGEVAALDDYSLEDLFLSFLLDYYVRYVE